MVQNRNDEPRLIPDPHRADDERGSFSRMAQPDYPVVEENLSHSVHVGTVRGLHWQEPQQAKFVRVLRGAILDACVRLSDGRVFTFEMDESSGSLLVPEGYAHGFCTREPDTLVSYKVSAAYAPDAQYGANPFDLELAIPWPTSPAFAVMSEKDASAPSFNAARHAAGLA